jgi:hypothetical protein
VLFRAGAAPWHDDRSLLARLAARLTTALTPTLTPILTPVPTLHPAPAAVRLFDSLHIWDLCALLAHARLQVGSSLHGHLIASAFGVPAVGLARPDEAGTLGKLSAYISTWETPADAAVRPVDPLAEAIRRALAGEAGPRHAQRQAWVAAYRAGFEWLTRGLG